MTKLRFALVSTLVAGWAVAAFGQSTQRSFDVVSIKRNMSGSPSIARNTTGPMFEMINVPMLVILTDVYDVKNVTNGPDWLTGERYDIVARAVGTPTRDDVKAMLRTMLEQRLKLMAHVEQREAEVYALVVTRPNHPGLKPFAGDCEAIRAEREAAMKAGQAPAPPSPTSGPACGYTWSSAIYSGGITLAELAGLIDYVAGRVIVDRTGLPGRYEFTLRFARPGVTGADDPNAPPVVFTALQEQLGLRLDAARAPVASLVIDHIERPGEN